MVGRFESFFLHISFYGAQLQKCAGLLYFKYSKMKKASLTVIFVIVALGVFFRILSYPSDYAVALGIVWLFIALFITIKIIKA